MCQKKKSQSDCFSVACPKTPLKLKFISSCQTTSVHRAGLPYFCKIQMSHKETNALCILTLQAALPRFWTVQVFPLFHSPFHALQNKAFQLISLQKDLFLELIHWTLNILKCPLTFSNKQIPECHCFPFGREKKTQNKMKKSPHQIVCSCYNMICPYLSNGHVKRKKKGGGRTILSISTKSQKRPFAHFWYNRYT